MNEFVGSSDLQSRAIAPGIPGDKETALSKSPSLSKVAGVALGIFAICYYAKSGNPEHSHLFSPDLSMSEWLLIDTPVCLKGDTYDVPVITSLGDAYEGLIPKIDFVKTTILQKIPGIVHHDVYYPNDVYKAIKRMPKAVLESREQVDRIVQSLAESSAFPWKYTKDGCIQRAELASYALEAMGIDKQDIKHVFILDDGNRLLNRGDKDSWLTHVAISVLLSDGTRIILDPSLDSEKSLTISEWIERINPALKDQCNEYNWKIQSKCRYFIEDRYPNPDLQFDNERLCLERTWKQLSQFREANSS